jgi:hypothetical protein
VQYSDFETIWGSLRHAWSYGRYIKIKTMRLLYLTELIEADFPDIRPKAGWGPRRTLGFFFPELADEESDDSWAAIERANSAADIARSYMADGKSGWFDVEVALCNYRQSLKKGYPSMNHDYELTHFQNVGNVDFPFFELRKRLFPPECLGELQGWTRTRDELSSVADKYIWCDLDYDYQATTDLLNPANRYRA